MKVYVITLVYLLFPFLIAYAFHRYKFLQKVGTVIMAYAVGVVMALTGVMTFEGADMAVQSQTMKTIQTWIMNISVPLAIPLLLFNCDFRLWTKSLPKTIAALVGGTLSIIIAVVTAFFIFRNSGIENLPDVAGMMTAIYTGGTMNFYALGSALAVDPTTITFVYTFEMLVTFPLLLFIVGGGYKLFRKLLPYKDANVVVSDDDVHVTDIEEYAGMVNKKVLPKTMLGLLISLVFLVIGAGLSLLITGKLNELVIILTITTLAIAASFSEKVRNLPKTFEMGMILILMFSIVVASQFDIYSLDTSALPLLYFVLYIMLTSVLLHLLFCRMSRVSGDLFTVAHIGLLCSPPFIPPVVGAMGNKKVLISGIAIGLAGYAIGTYLGVAMAYLLQLC